MILSEAEIVAITKKVRYKAQARELVRMGIPYKVRKDGSLVVFRENISAPTPAKQKDPQVRIPPPRFPPKSEP